MFSCREVSCWGSKQPHYSNFIRYTRKTWRISYFPCQKKSCLEKLKEQVVKRGEQKRKKRRSLLPLTDCVLYPIFGVQSETANFPSE